MKETPRRRTQAEIQQAIGSPRDDLAVQVKYGLDRVFGTLGTLALAPVLAGIAAAIKLDDGGPTLFVQSRPGLRGEMFPMYKFRTMVVDADRFIDERGRPTRHRITRVGRFLRRTSLDELPQLLNFALGHMSFVGPRPPLEAHLHRYSDRQMKRFRMKPGLTGLAQVHGRNTVKWSRRLELDNQYVETFSLILDAHILLKTATLVLLGRGIVADRNPDDVDDLPEFGFWHRQLDTRQP